MRLARELERRLERLVESTTGAVFRGRMHPVEMADRLVRQVDFLREDGPAGPEIPNHLVVSVNPADLDPELDVEALCAELAHTVQETAKERGWRTGGPVTVRIEADRTTPRGLIEVVGAREEGSAPYWGQLIADDGRTVLPLSDNRVVIGRALDADAVLSDPEVSRHHALVVRDGNGVHLSDLGSSNGTFVNGRPVGNDPVRLVPGDEVLLGEHRFVLRTVG